jgi:adenine-specific DNA glycosylase
VQEIATAMAGTPDAGAKAQRLVQFLQELFELDYNFSLEGIEKKGLKHAAKQLARYPGVTDFAIAWVTQRSFGGHAVPLDDAGLRVLRRLKIIDDDADDIETLRGRIEHQVSKSEGAAFTEALSELAAELCTDAKPACGKCALNRDCPTGQVFSNPKSKPDAPAKPKAKPKAK